MQNQIPLQSIKFKGTIQLLKESWILYRSRIKTFLGLMAIPVLFSFLSKVLVYYLSLSQMRYSILFSFAWAIFSGISLFLWLWAIPSLIFSIKEKIGAREAYKKGLKILISYIWIYFLLNAIVIGGFFLFIVPGVLFFIWFSLAILVLIFEEKKGMNALFKSKHLISGKFWGVLRRFLEFGLIILIILILIFVLPFLLFKINKPTADRIGNILGYFLQLFIAPFALIYGALIYENLEKIKREIPYQEPTTKRKLKYLLPGILGTLILLLVASFNFLNIFLGRDIPPVDDSDLWLSKIEIPKEENAFYYLAPYFHLSQLGKEIIIEYLPGGEEILKESKEIYWPTEKRELIEKIIAGEEWDEELVKDLLKNNEQVLNDFEKAVQCPYFQNPAIRDPKIVWTGTSVFLSLRDLLTITNLNLIESIYLFKQGQEKEAFDEVIKSIRLGQMLEDSPRGFLISYLVGMRIKGIGLEKLRAMLPETNLSPETLKGYADNLEQFKLKKEALKNVFKMEYISLSNTKAKIDAAFFGKLLKGELEKLGIEKVSFPGKLAMNLYYKPNKTQRMFIESFRVLINNADKSYKEMEFPEFKLLEPRSKVKMLFTENSIGKMLHDIVWISYKGIFAQKCQEDFSLAGTQILMAIRIYQIENGKIPDSLADLVPAYILEVPKDPFDGEFIRYFPEKKIIYSVGEDLKDSEGEKGDLSFKIEF